MNFFADKQTLDDLNIPGKHKNNSIARLFGSAVTAGGKRLMDKMFQTPLDDADEINKRSDLFQYFTRNPVSFPYTGEEFLVMENYLNSGGASFVAATWTTVSKKVLQLVAQDREYELLNDEVSKTIELLKRFNQFLNQQWLAESPYHEQLREAKNIFSDQKLSWLFTEVEVGALTLSKLIKYDYLLSSKLKKEMQQLTDLIARLDVYIAVATVARQKDFNYAKAFPKESNTLKVEGLFHPMVDKAIGNSLSMDNDCNVIFLTGANMAGKSTLMKSFGIAIYLAHMGFPVAATEMQFSLKDGLYTSINVPDNLDMGYSHFYAEVLRVKTIAEQVATGRDLIVMFDELFKGTNVKDAYDATLAITEAFSENHNCFFVISTHIVEVGESLRQQFNNFRFAYLPTVMEGSALKYTYRLEEGITTDRQGMMIIENEGILRILRGEKI